MSLRIFLVSLVVAIASGCASTPLKQFPEFPAQYDQSARTRVLVDVAIAEDVKGGRDQITLETNRFLAQALTNTLAAGMHQQGYTVDQAYPGVVGLYLSSTMQLQLREASSSPEVMDSLAVGPFYMDDIVRADTLLLSVLDGVMGGQSPVVARTEQPEAFVLLVVRGRRVPAMKSFGQGLLTGVASSLLTGGLVSVAVWETSGAAVELMIVDGTSGSLLWRDAQVSQSDASDGAIHRMVRRLASRLPRRTA